MPVKGGECGCNKKGGAKKGAKKQSPYNKFMSSEIKRLKKLPQYKNAKHTDVFKQAAQNWSSKK